MVVNPCALWRAAGSVTHPGNRQAGCGWRVQGEGNGADSLVSIEKACQCGGEKIYGGGDMQGCPQSHKPQQSQTGKVCVGEERMLGGVNSVARYGHVFCHVWSCA